MCVLALAVYPLESRTFVPRPGSSRRSSSSNLKPHLQMCTSILGPAGQTGKAANQGQYKTVPGRTARLEFGKPEENRRAEKGIQGDEPKKKEYASRQRLCTVDKPIGQCATESIIDF